MRIRYKLMIVLLFVSLLPMIAMRLNGQRTLKEMGDELASGAGAELIDQAEVSLKRLVEDHARVLKRERELVETILLTISSEMHSSLFGEVHPETWNFVAYFEEGNPGSGTLTDSARSEEHTEYCILMPSGKCTPIPIDYSRQQVSRFDGFANGEIAGDSSQRLDSMVPLYRALKEKYPELVLWIHARLENGVETTYPYSQTKRGGRIRAQGNAEPSWYKLDRTRNSVFWSKPSRDLLTGNLVFHVSRPLRDPEGKSVGTVAIAVPVNVFLHENKHIRMLSEHVTSLIVKADPSPLHPIRIVAKEGENKGTHMHWHAAEREEWLETPDESALRKIAADIENGRSGVTKILYGGVLNLAAYGSFDSYGDTLLLLVPEKDILADAAAMENYVRERIDQQIAFTGVVLTSIALMTVLLSYVLSRSFTKNISKVAEAVERVGAGDFSARVGLDTKDELGELGRRFDAMVPSMEEHVCLKQTLDFAMEVQRNLLPHSVPKMEGFDIAAGSVYCQETGGDFYDFVDVRRDGSPRMAIVVGDVSGHGLSAALLMATCRAFLRARLAQPGEMADTISDVNKLVVRDTMETNQFVTLFYLEIDREGKTFRWIRAGHDPAVLYDPEKDEFFELRGPGAALGIAPDFPFEPSEVRAFRPGQVLLVGTDGIWETMNPEGELFGKERLKDAIRNSAGKTAGEILETVFSELSGFRKDQRRDDDITIVVVKHGH